MRVYLLLVLEKGELVCKRKDRSPNTGDFEDGWGGAESPSRESWRSPLGLGWNSVSTKL